MIGGRVTHREWDCFGAVFRNDSIVSVERKHADVLRDIGVSPSLVLSQSWGCCSSLPLIFPKNCSRSAKDDAGAAEEPLELWSDDLAENPRSSGGSLLLVQPFMRESRNSGLML